MNILKKFCVFFPCAFIVHLVLNLMMKSEIMLTSSFISALGLSVGFLLLQSYEAYNKRKYRQEGC